jgi:hypothetical protein
MPTPGALVSDVLTEVALLVGYRQQYGVDRTGCPERPMIRRSVSRWEDALERRASGSASMVVIILDRHCNIV